MTTTYDNFNDLPFVYNGKVKMGSWKDKNNRKIYFDYLGEKLGFDTPEKWYKLTAKMLEKNHGGSILNLELYKRSHIKFVMDMIPEYEWFEFLFTTSPRHLWKEIENHKRYGIWLGRIKGYKYLEDWYNCSLKDFHDNRGGGLLANYYEDSPCLFILTIVNKLYPGKRFLPWKLDKCPQNFWNKPENQREYIIWLGKELEYDTQEKWYKITGDIIRNNYGHGIINKYNGSPSLILKSIFSNIEWFEWLFDMSPLNIFNNDNTKKRFFIWLGKELGYDKPEKWYNLTLKLLHTNHGRTIGSVKDLLNEMLPEIEWIEWKFKMVSPSFWDKFENQKNYMNWLFKELNYTEMEDLYNISAAIINNNCGGGLMALHYNSSPALLVTSIYPNYLWVLSKFKKNYSTGQIEWLNYLSIETPDIRHILNDTNGEFSIPNTKYHADGFSKIKFIIYEYLGDFWHGNPKTYNEDDINRVTKTTFGELYQKTLKKQMDCEELGYVYIYIWESEWIRAKLAVIQLQRNFRKKYYFKV
jgi:hypothetical protein